MDSPLSSRTRSANQSPCTIEMIRSAHHRFHSDTPWLLIAGLILLGFIGLFFGLRLWLISSIQVPLEGRLEYLMDWLGLPVSLSSLTWMLTFGIGAFTAWPLVKKSLFFFTGIPWFCPTPNEWLLLLILPASTFVPATVQTICPIREVDPVSTDWFYPDEHPETGKPHGRLGYLREEDGTWKFYNIPVFIRPADAASVHRVTPEVRRQWQQDIARLQELERRRTAAEQADLSAREEQRRQHEERMSQLRLETARQEAEKARAADAVAEAEKARQEALVAQQRAEQESAARAAAEKAHAEAEKMAKVHLAEAQAAQRSAQKKAEQVESERQRIQAAQEYRRQQEASTQNLPISLRLDSTGNSMPHPKAVEDVGQIFPIQRGLWKHIHVRGYRVEVCSDGPVILGADSYAPRTYPGGAWVRFERGAGTLHAQSLGPGSSHLRVRKL